MRETASAVALTGPTGVAGREGADAGATGATGAVIALGETGGVVPAGLAAAAAAAPAAPAGDQGTESQAASAWLEAGSGAGGGVSTAADAALRTSDDAELPLSEPEGAWWAPDAGEDTLVTGLAVRLWFCFLLGGGVGGEV